VRVTCLNLLYLNQLTLSLMLSKFYNITIEELDQFDQFMTFVYDKFSDIKNLPKCELNQIYTKACLKRLEIQSQYVKVVQSDSQRQIDNSYQQLLDL
jgi:hypothetical protein